MSSKLYSDNAEEIQSKSESNSCIGEDIRRKARPE